MRSLPYFSAFLVFILLSACNNQASDTTAAQPEVIQDTIIQEIEVPKIVRDTVFQKVENANWIRQSRGLLYLQCGNDFSFIVDEDVEGIVVSSKDADVIPSKKTVNRYRIVPKSKRAVLTVAQRNKGVVGPSVDLNYWVMTPPKPNIELSINGKPTGGTTPIPKSSRVTIKVIPDTDFKANFPEDARYMISSVDVLAQLSLGPPQKVNSVNTNGRDATKAMAISLGTQVRQARPGTKIYLRINDVYRRNFQNKRIPVKLTEQERTIGFVVR